ncbi:chemotaxis protein CheA (plasmid) [Paroceanicella profunda]|uniref:Chemotaxis protein CheA n=1 Tax=Paroceanicella profunda TaxID=2579971 RepID=A0A5B8G0U0_9RHOB|nr:chemotaxis protein CheA [Paroceanicella profunda]QDL94746.1 chemotaxis protein CheA [Paroceanicella profunda]
MAMDDAEDYQAIFFSECSELLVDLQERLDELLDGGGSMDTVNAAFRAVHSIKGGAAAFGFRDLIAFAHVFETVMDQVRSETLELTPEVCSILMRAGDVIAVLVEHARDGGELPEERVERVLGELRELGNLEAPAEKPAEAAPAPVAEEVLEEGGFHEFSVTITISDNFLFSGHDPLKMIRALKAHGLSRVTPPETIAPLAEIDLHAGGLTWTLDFESDAPASALDGFFDIYRHAADIDVILPAPEEGADPAGESEAPPAAAAPAQAPAVAAPPAEAAPARPAAASGGGGRGAGAAGGGNGGGSSGGDGGEHPVEKPKMAKSLRVELPRIDRLVNLVGEIVITQAVMAQKLSEIDTSGNLELGHAVESMTRQTRELQESVMAIRAQPVKSVFQRMPRVVRDLSDTLKKEARLVLAGEHTEVDTTVIEELAEPLTHMLRNSMDHGLEGNDEREQLGKSRIGTIRLAAEHRGERVIISIEDDGRGINRERVLSKAIEKGLVQPEEQLTPDDIDNLIFHPGFSTASEISSVSGRGVGMDVVKKKIQTLGGRCTLRNVPGKGLKFMITLPLTLAVLDGMTICVGDQRFILPLSSVIEALRIEDDQTEALPNGGRVMFLRGQYLPLISLRQALRVEGPVHHEDMAIVVDTETNGLVALLVDELIGQRQVVLKSLEANFRRVEGVSGATILGDGRVALILDVPALVRGGPGASSGMEMYH